MSQENLLTLPSGLQIKTIKSVLSADVDGVKSPDVICYEAFVVSQLGVRATGKTRQEALGTLLEVMDAMRFAVKNTVMDEARRYRKLRAIITQDGFASDGMESLNACRNIVFE